MEKLCLLESFYNNVFEYQKVFKFSCIHNACVQLLKYYQIENYVLYLDCSYDLSLHIQSDSSMDFYYELNAVINPAYYCFSHLSSDTAINTLIDQNKHTIRNGFPVIIGVDYFYMPHHNCYQKDHGAHAIYLCGFDDVKKSFYIVDPNQDKIYRGTISSDLLTKARMSENAWNGHINSGGNIRFASLNLYPERMICANHQLLLMNIYKNNDHFYDQGEQGEVRGLAALYYIYSILKDYKISNDYSKWFMDLYINLLFFFSKRNLFEYYIQYADNKIEGLHVGNLQRAITQLNVTWKVFLQVLLKTANSKVYNPRLYLDSIDLFENILRDEEQLKIEMKSMIG